MNIPSMSVIDPSLELIDPTPDIHDLFMEFNTRFFGGALACCEVKWSPRMYSCAGICSYEVRGGRGGLCSIRLSKPLLTLRPRKDLVETLLHEMIHAFLFVKERNRDRDGHGPHFQSHMHRINKEAGTNITIYHSFHQEVAMYKTHWWRCNGMCKNKRPFYGYVKRSSNREPGPNDLWWAQHQASCGGKFIKIKEPESYGQKKKRSKEPVKNFSPPVQKNTLDNYYVAAGKPTRNSKTTLTKVLNKKKDLVIFGGTGKKLGGDRTAQSVVSDRLPKSNDLPRKHNPTKIEVIVLDDSDEERSSSSQTKMIKKSDAKKSDSPEIYVDCDDLEVSFVVPGLPGSAQMIICPSCNTEVAEELINAHLDNCLA
ncbi:unnamed protein product [Caenorhabditis bovis]|uniref:Protein with SprT-like domain at the N terminus n=1 Tax=Caenorhabditis bovis TaxID=2654633 RepID=A0A8S1EFN2_9PELO|nr:unnamed protein product [Caenorhabditis bovis]